MVAEATQLRLRALRQRKRGTGRASRVIAHEQRDQWPAVTERRSRARRGRSLETDGGRKPRTESLGRARPARRPEPRAQPGGHSARQDGEPVARTTGAQADRLGTIHTIERLIGVIPEAIWIALGALTLLALALAGSSWLAFARARRSERQRRHLAADIGLLQAALLPVIPERFGAVEVSVAYRPADGAGGGR